MLIYRHKNKNYPSTHLHIVPVTIRWIYSNYSQNWLLSLGEKSTNMKKNILQKLPGVLDTGNSLVNVSWNVFFSGVKETQQYLAG